MKRKNKIVIGIIIIVCVIVAGIIGKIEINSSKSEAKNKDKSSMNSKQMLQSQHSSHNTEKTQKKTAATDRTKSSAKSDLDKEAKVDLSKKSQSNPVNSQTVGKALDSNKTKSTNKSLSITGYITSEDDFAAGLKEDTANMVYMRLMALSGLGITFQQNGNWVFYYFDGGIASDNKSGADGKWIFNGSGSQLNAWNIVQKRVKEGKGKYPVQVTVKGVLKGNIGTNPGPDADSKKFPVITVESIN
ncbi:hypothetical protein ACSVC9_07740 [Clostridium sp. LBM24168]